MREPPEGNPRRDGTILALIVSLFLFSPQAFTLWSNYPRIWFAPYLIWAAVVILVLLVRRDKHEL